MNNQTANDECGICLEKLTASVTLPCKHKFCASCLDGWKSKFGSSLKKERSKACPLCRKKIPPSKDVLIQLECHRTRKRELEARGDTSSQYYLNHLGFIKELEAEIGDYDGEGIDYDGCMELPNEIANALETNNIKRVMEWLGSPIEKKRLNARNPDLLNSTLVHLAVYAKKSGLLSILLQYGADVNALDANGWNPFMIATKPIRFEHAKILLEWGVEISFRDKAGFYNKDEVIRVIKESGNIKLANLVSSDFGGSKM